MRLVSCALFAICVTATGAAAQSAGDVQIRIGDYRVSTDGGEKPGGLSFGTGRIAIGKTASGFISLPKADCGALTLGPTAPPNSEKAFAVWKFEVTPTRVNASAVTFTLRFQMGTTYRGVVTFMESTPWNTTELTLRPGESWPWQLLRRLNLPSCYDALLRLQVEPVPSADNEQRLFGVDLWLVERSGSGEAQRSQPLAIRVTPNQAAPFYFDRIADGAAVLEIHGTLTARPADDRIAVGLDTRSRGRPAGGAAAEPERSVLSDVLVKPSEIVEIRLPSVEQPAAFSKRAFSIRVRIRQLR